MRDWIEKLNQASARQLILFIFIVGFIVYANSLFNGFVWDDEEQVVNNPVIQNFGNFPLLFKSSTFNSGGAGLTGWYYKPLMPFSYMINYAIWGLKPFGYHLFQILIHFVNSSLVFLIFLRLFKETKNLKPKMIAFFAALVFLVHPGNVEAVSYVAAVQDTLYSLFGLLTLFVFLISKESKRSWLNFLAIGSLFLLLSLLSKEAGIFIIPLVFLYLFLFHKEKIFSWTTASFFVFAFYLFLRVGIAKIPLAYPKAIVPIAQANLFQRLLTIPYEIFSYLRILVFPKDLFIAQHEVVKQISDFMFWGLLFPIIVFLLFCLWFFIKTKSRLFLFFVFWFIGSLGIVFNLFPLDMTIAERWLYFPMVGFLGMISVMVVQLIKLRPKAAFYLFPFLIILLILFSLRTVVRNSNWRNGFILFAHDISYSQNSFDLENNYGVELFRRNQIEEAKSHFEKSIELQPEWWTPYNNLGAVFQKGGDLKTAERLYGESISKGEYYLAYENLGFLLLKTEQKSQAIDFLNQALVKFPQNSNLNRVLALAYYQSGLTEKAEIFAKRAVFLEPSELNRAILRLIIERKKISW